MKISFIFLLIIAVASATGNREEWKNTANNLLEKIGFIEQDIKTIRGDLRKASVKAQEGDDQIELGISNDAKIKEIEQQLKSSASNGNIEECQNLFVQSRQALKYELGNLLKNELIKNANSINESIIYVEKELSDISANLQAQNLEEEISSCISGNICKLTGEYAMKIDINENVIKNFENLSRLAVDYILLTKINVQLENQIDSKVYFPVKACLNK